MFQKTILGIRQPKRGQITSGICAIVKLDNTIDCLGNDDCEQLCRRVLTSPSTDPCIAAPASTAHAWCSRQRENHSRPTAGRDARPVLRELQMSSAGNCVPEDAQKVGQGACGRRKGTGH